MEERALSMHDGAGAPAQPACRVCVLTHGFQFGVERAGRLLDVPDFALERTEPLAGGRDLALQLVEDGARVPGQVGELAQGARKHHVADGAQILEERALVVGDGVSAQELRLHDPLGERHFAPPPKPPLFFPSCLAAGRGNTNPKSREKTRVPVSQAKIHERAVRPSISGLGREEGGGFHTRMELRFPMRGSRSPPDPGRF